MRRFAGVIAFLVVLAGCSGGGDRTSESEPTVSSSAVDDHDDGDASDDVSTLEATLANIPLAVHVHPIERSGELAVLTIDVEITGEVPNRDDHPYKTLVVDAIVGTPLNGRGYELFSLVDRGREEVIPIAFTQDNHGARTEQALIFRDGENGPVTSHMFYAAPENDVVDVFLPLIGYAKDVPVVDVAEEELAAHPAEEGLGDLTLRRASLEQYSVAHDGNSTLRAEGEKTTLTLASDVLFDTGEHELSQNAKKVVNKAADDIRDLADGGEIHLVGHTDDVSSASFNQKLSERRANSVKKDLEKDLGSSYTFTAEGRGKSEPIVEGTSPAAREANRRVEIEFSTNVEQDSEEIASLDALPETEGPVVEESNLVTFTASDREYELSIGEVQALDDDFLHASFQLRQISKEKKPLLEVFGDIMGAWSHGRGVGTYTLISGTGNFTLLKGDEYVFPIDFETPEEQDSSGEERRRVLGAGAPTGSFVGGDVFQYDVVWPNPGTDTVIIDIPDVVRFVDVPVTK